jgi:hypothetical protein
MRFLFVAALVFVTTSGATAQPYCMLDDSGGRTCGIPTLAECERTRSGVGGSCEVDDSAQLAAPIKGPFQRMFERAEQQEADYQKPSSPALDDVPPPPGN